ncbi:MAG: DUF2961 domain-containing protein [Actinocatenispora sp.]
MARSRRLTTRAGAALGALALALSAVSLNVAGAAAPPAYAAPAHAAPGDNGPVGWDTYRHPERLAELAPGTRTRQFSSFDRTGGNDDGFGGTYSCLRTTGQRCVIAEQAGAGEIDSIWFTRDGGDVTKTGTITIVLDGRTVLDAPAQDVVDGKLGAPFSYPLVANADQSSGGVYVKVPMPFRESMTVTTDANPLFYHVSYRQFADPTGVTTFDPSDHAEDVLSTLRAAGTADPKPPQTGATSTDAALDVPAGGTATVADLTGPGALSALRLTLPQLTAPGGDPDGVRATDRILADARLRVTMDGQRTVDAPLGEFFGTGMGLYPVRALMFGVDPGARTFDSWWLMPYRQHAVVQVENGSDTDITGGHATVTSARSAQWRHALADGGPDGYFRATAQRAATVPGADHEFLDTTGRGRLLGVSHTMIGDIPSGNQRDYLEGDERLYVDGSASPDMHGTGTEDFYESGWYFNRETYSDPMNGNTAHETGTADCRYDCTTAYRLLLAEGPGFSSSIRFGIEHGPGDNEPATYGSTAFWYGQAEDGLHWTDSLTVGDPDSESDHDYRSTDPGDVQQLTSTYEGNDGAPAPVTATLRASTAAVSFRLAVDPANQGLILRRTGDQQKAYQAAAVSVDGTPPGTWSQPLANGSHRWLDDSYRLPASLTAHKQAVTVTLTPTDGAPAWNAASYQALSEVPTYTDSGAPDAVGPLEVSGGQGSMSVRWRPVRDDVYRPAYQVYASTDPGFTPGPDTLVGSTELPAFTHSGLGASQHWYYRVRAVDAADHAGGFSAEGDGTTGDTIRLEAETLLPPESASAPVAAQSDCCGVHWSGSTQLWFQPTDAGKAVTVRFTVPSAGRYALSAVQTGAKDYGTDTLALDGDQVGSPYDAYHADTVVVSDPIDYGEHQLSAGPHTLTLTVTGHNPASVGYFAGLDYLSLRLLG